MRKNRAHRPLVLFRRLLRLAWIKTTGTRRGPDFIIIGAQRCGTTSLYDYISTYSTNFVPAERKETQYFSELFDRSIDRYLSLFPVFRGGRLTGEASPTYAFPASIPKRVHDAFPDTKLILIVRDPVERAISHRKLIDKLGDEYADDLSFLEALKTEENRIQLAPGQSYSWSYKIHSYKLRGLYAEQMERWLDLFPRDQLLVVHLGDLETAFGETMRRIAGFVGLELVSELPEELPYRTNATKKGDAYRGPEVLEYLGQFFQQPNQRFYELVGRDFGWTSVKPGTLDDNDSN